MGVFTVLTVFAFFISVLVYCASPEGSGDLGNSSSPQSSPPRVTDGKNESSSDITTCVPGMSGCTSGGTEFVTIQEARMVDYVGDFFFYQETAKSMGRVLGKCASFKVRRDKLSDEVDQFLEQNWQKGRTTKISFHRNSVVSCTLAPPNFCTLCEPPVR